MTEQEYIHRLKSMWPQDSDASLESVALADKAVSAFPRSTRLWCMRGDLIQLGPKECPHPLDEALTSYRRAVELDPQCAEAWESIGHYHDAVLDDESAPQSPPKRSTEPPPSSSRGNSDASEGRRSVSFTLGRCV